MAIVLLKNVTGRVNIIKQQNTILKYATANGVPINSTEVETSNYTLSLEDRKELKGFLRSLDSDETILIYELWTLSAYVDELIKIFECLLKRNISLHVCASGEVISNETPLLKILEILSLLRDERLNPSAKVKQGRPKGRMSKSKFDVYRQEVIQMLEDDISVSEIAKELNVSRSSLKDYINSRGLKTLAKTKKKILILPTKKFKQKQTPIKKECDLISETNSS
ncbi:MAG: helix-turn-helix domain-containing protein [Sulfurospirillaceae bacterium]|jgi:DNA invertase Pin-like site-specific DNA recombinase|nr:helix-turn-helix domain-containing protein [Sulfurospirillaceae bacterium]MCK9545086.1 helix-turn-helix domain-containing protein [Sulfurospirillaceae bacterium]NLN00031.1 recombinase family protein [Campylobacteraceae bacterium]